MKIRKIEMPKDKYSIKCPYKMKPEGIVVHNTFNNAPASAEAHYMQSNSNQVSFHAVVDEKEVIECAPFDRNCWHCSNRKGNLSTIGIEIARSKHKDEKLFLQAEKNAAEYVAYLLKKFNLTIKDVYTHQHFKPSKRCPHHTLDLGWNRFLKMIEAHLNKTTDKKFKPYQVTINSPDGVLNIREKPNSKAKKTGQLKNGSIKYTIVAEEKNWGKLKSGAGFIYLKYVTRVGK